MRDETLKELEAAIDDERENLRIAVEGGDADYMAAARRRDRAMWPVDALLRNLAPTLVAGVKRLCEERDARSITLDRLYSFFLPLISDRGDSKHWGDHGIDFVTETIAERDALRAVVDRTAGFLAWLTAAENQKNLSGVTIMNGATEAWKLLAAIRAMPAAARSAPTGTLPASPTVPAAGSPHVPAARGDDADAGDGGTQ